MWTQEHLRSVTLRVCFSVNEAIVCHHKHGIFTNRSWWTNSGVFSGSLTPSLGGRDFLRVKGLLRASVCVVPSASFHDVSQQPPCATQLETGSVQVQSAPTTRALLVILVPLNVNVSVRQAASCINTAGTRPQSALQIKPSLKVAQIALRRC